MLLPVFNACDRLEDNLIMSDEVKLTASLSPVLSSVYTKGAGEIKSTHAGELGIGVAKVLGNDGNFDYAEASSLPATMSAPSDGTIGLREIRFDDFQGFPDANTKLYYTAWYPQDATYSKTDDEHTNVTFAIPTDASTDILYSDVTSGTRLSGFKPMTFQHALVKYTVKVYAMESDDAPGSVADTWGKIQSVTFEGMQSDCILTLPTSPTNTQTVSFAGETKDLTREIPAFDKIPVGFSKAAELTYFLAPPPSGENKVLNIKVVTEKSPDGKSVKTSIARDFQIGKHYQIYLRFTTHGIINAEVVAGDWIDSEEFLHVDTNTGVFYDLSESHNANTYVVSSAYSYCFDATVRGNGYTGVVGILGSTTDIHKVGNPVTAEVVWTDLVSSTSENLDEIFTLVPNVVEGRIFFTVKPRTETDRALKKEGNVVIGVRDASGKMLWTWHIWLTDRPAEQSYKNGFNVQDRDMGAVSYNAESEPSGINGLFYQWGRPTPLPLDKTVYKPVYNSNGVWTGNQVVTYTSSDEVVSVIERVKSPLVFFNKRATSSDGTNTKSLWGWRTTTDEYAKTIYDPCPPGYRMPSIKLWRDLVIWDKNGDGRRDAETVGGNIAVKFKVDVNHVDVYYPMTGYYESKDSHINASRGAYMWAATYYVGTLNDADDDQPYALDFALNDGGTLQELETRLEYSNYAMPVRCVSRMSKAHVTNLSDYQTANSYMVSKNGFYKFKATVRGNGIGQLVSPGSTSTIVLTEQLQSVDIKNQLVNVKPLWWVPAAGTSVAVPDFSLLNNGTPDADGYVSFEVKTFNEGNLILAGYDAKGTIIWSWHIWFTDEPQMMKSNSFVVMDRNLGSTYAPSSTSEPTGNALDQTYGLYYQWGRKDPFTVPGTIVYRYDNGNYVQSSTFSTQAAKESKTVENSVKNPMVFHLASEAPATGGIFNDNDFFSGLTVSDVDNSLANQCFSNMVHPDNNKSLWGYSAASGYGVTTTKTMYDPCPPGYIVAHYLVWTNTERNGDGNYNYYSYLDSGWKYHYISGSKGFFTTEHSDIFDPAWYPFGGYIDGKTGNMEQNGTMGIFHTSTPAGNGSRSLAYGKYSSIGSLVQEVLRDSGSHYPVTQMSTLQMVCIFKVNSWPQ